MNKYKLIIAGFLLIAPHLFAATNSLCATKYPVLLVHGLGFRDDIKGIDYWGSIPSRLTNEGCRVFFSGHDAWNSHEKNAFDIRLRILSIVSQTGCEKVNIIAHSKGGLDCRYMIAKMGMGPQVVTLTMLSTPNRGSALSDILLNAVGGTNNHFALGLVDLFAMVIGDRSPDSARASIEVSTNFMKTFNREILDDPRVYYQSFGCSLLEPVRQPEFRLSYKLIKKCQGANDGIVPVSSAAWGEYRRTLTGKYGVSHTDIIHVGRKKVRGFDVPGFYVEVVRELKRKGY